MEFKNNTIPQIYESGTTKLSLIHAMRKNSSNIFNDMTDEIWRILLDLYNTNIQENIDLKSELQLLFYTLREWLECDKLYELMFSFYETNPHHRGEEFRIYLDVFLNRDKAEKENIFTLIFRDINSLDISKLSFIVTILNKIASSQYYKEMDFKCGITNYDILLIIKVITAYCFNENFVSYIGIKLLDEELNETQFKVYNEFYIQYIYGNYKSTSNKVAMAYPYLTNQQKLLIEEIKREYSRQEKQYSNSKGIKIFQSSHRRMIEFQKRRNKQMQKASDLGRKNSIFFDLFSEDTIKYGKRVAILYESNEDTGELEEYELQEHQYSLELPFIFTNDPLKLASQRLEILHWRDSIDETCN